MRRRTVTSEHGAVKGRGEGRPEKKSATPITLPRGKGGGKKDPLEKGVSLSG